MPPSWFKKILWGLLFAVGLSHAPKVHAAACCAGSSAIPALITSDDRGFLSLGFSSSAVVGDSLAPGSAYPRSASASELTRLWKLETAWIFGDVFQAGVQLPFSMREASGRSGSGMGDVRFSLGWEFLPEWDYSAWRPRGFAFLQIQSPTGKSVYDTLDLWEQTGGGVWQIGSGVFLTKRWGDVDASVFGELHYGFDRSYTDSGTDSVSILKTGWGASGGFSLGWTPGGERVRLGAGILSSYQAGKKTIFADGTSSQGGAQVATPLSFDLSWVADDRWVAQVSYLNGAVLGPVANSALSQTLSVSLRHAFLR